VPTADTDADTDSLLKDIRSFLGWYRELHEPSKKNDKFLEELKSQYARDLENKNQLDSKANNMVTMSSAISTLLIGIGTFLVSRLSSQTWVFSLGIVLLFIGVISSGIAIMFFLFSLKIRSFAVPFDSRGYIKLDRNYKKQLKKKTSLEKWKFLEDKINVTGKNGTEHYRNLEKDEFEKESIRLYLLSLFQNSDALWRKADFLRRGQWFFLVLSLWSPQF
jgi:hypothetical protein